MKIMLVALALAAPGIASAEVSSLGGVQPVRQWDPMRPARIESPSMTGVPSILSRTDADDAEFRAMDADGDGRVDPREHAEWSRREKAARLRAAEFSLFGYNRDDPGHPCEALRRMGIVAKAPADR